MYYFLYFKIAVLFDVLDIEKLTTPHITDY